MSYKDILNKKAKEWNCSSLMDGAKAPRGSKLPFSSALMNYSTYGGIPRNKITEFFGDPGSGKSTSAVDICKNAVEIFRKEHEAKLEELRQKVISGNKAAKSELEDLTEKGPKKILYIDIEHSFDEAWSNTLGINPDEIDIMTPPDIPAEDMLNAVMEIVESGEVGLIVLDSIPSLVPRAELEKKLGERTVASLAGLLTVFFRKVVPLLTRYECTLLLINQVRANMDNPYVVKTPGGEALKFYCCLRILFRLGAPVDFLGNELPQSTENPAGYLINAKLTKQKSAPFDRKNATYYLMCSSGIRSDFDFAQLGIKKYGFIAKGGAWFTLSDPFTGEVLEDSEGKIVKINGLAKVYEYLKENPEYYERVKSFVLQDIESNGACVKDPDADPENNEGIFDE